MEGISSSKTAAVLSNSVSIMEPCNLSQMETHLLQFINCHEAKDMCFSIEIFSKPRQDVGTKIVVFTEFRQ